MLTNSAIAESVNIGVQVIPIPGASAVIAALSASGLPTHEFTFLGFLPHKKGEKLYLGKLLNQNALWFFTNLRIVF